MGSGLGLCASLAIPLLLEPWRKRVQRKAAVIQEMFDCNLLQLEWRRTQVGPRVAPEDVHGAMTAYGRRVDNTDDLLNWYPQGAGQVPLSLARIICQRANCTWERKLRRRYATYVGLSAFAVVAILLVVGIAAEFTISDLLLSVAVPALPVVGLGAREFRAHRDAATSSERLALHAQDVLEKVQPPALDVTRLQDEARSLQNEIFARRASAPPLFDWVYQRLRSANDEEMNNAASQIAAQLTTTSYAPEN